MATLQLKNITKRFGKDVVAVKNVSLEVHEGEYLVLLGPSGCGKTTTMRMVAGLEEATHGTIILDGKDITDLPPRKRDVSMVFQSYLAAHDRLRKYRFCVETPQDAESGD